MGFEFATVEEIIGYAFKNKNLLKIGFTHPSYSNEHRDSANYERLEFLGDSVLGFIVSEYLFLRERKSDEGVLTREKQKYVSTTPLADAIKKLGLNEYVLFGHGNVRDKNKNSVCENLFESIVAMLYLDGGMDVAKKFVTDNLLNDVKKEDKIDYKSELQKLTQAKKLGLPTYRIISKTGPDHDPTFTAEVIVAGTSYGVAIGGKKAEAESECAKLALKKFKMEI